MIESAPPQIQVASARRSWLIGLTSFGFILLQSVCTAFMAISGLRLLISAGSLAAAVADAKTLDPIHDSGLRIPMMLLAVGGSIVNLYAIWRVRSLRARPSSQWRMAPASPAKKRAESIQIILAVVTLILVGVESFAHVRQFGGLFR